MSRHAEARLATSHFTFAWYDEAGPDAQANIEAVAPTAEADLETLATVFGLTIPLIWGPIDVRTNLTTWGASNGGYGARGLNMFSLSRAGQPSGVVDEGMRAFFVAELAEILMDYRNITVAGAGPWNAGDSAGEGLSRVMEAEVRRQGFYSLTPRTTWLWIDAGGPDYVSTSYPSDTHGPSFACAFMFLYYLHSQLGHSWHDIVTANGTTLQDKYAALGHTDNGFTAMTNLLVEFFGSIGVIPDPPDNPFPLLLDGRRFARLSVSDNTEIGIMPVASGSVMISAGGLCAPATYGYRTYDVSGSVTISAWLYGFASPSFAWTINGVSVPPSGTPAISILATVTAIDPANPNAEPIANQSVTLSVAFTSTGPSRTSEISISSPSHNVGVISLRIGVTVSEMHATGASTASAIAYATIATQRVVYDDPYARDRARCQADLTKLLETEPKIYRIPPSLLDYRPDPAPETRVIAEILAGLQHAAATVRTMDPKRANAIIQGLANAYGVPASLLDIPSAKQ